MTEDGDLKKFCADMVENMPIPSIRKKMKADKELVFTDLDKCTHVALDQRKMTEVENLRNRDLEIFSDDLFKYLFVRRLNITEHRSVLTRTPDDPTSNFHSDIGKSILVCTYLMQKNIFLEILQTKLEIQNVDSIGHYFTEKAFATLNMTQYNIFLKLRILGSITLEIITFCYIRGNTNALSYGARLYFAAFREIFKNDFYSKGAWNAWRKCASTDVQFYDLSKMEFVIENTQLLACSMWLTRFDRFLVRLPLETCDQTESALTNDESSNKSDNEKNLNDAASNDTEKIPDGVDEAMREKLRCIILKDCFIAKRYKSFSNFMVLDLIEIIARTKDSAYEELYSIIENDACVKKLMRYCIFSRLIVKLKDPKMRLKIRNTDILQFVKLILGDNARTAAYCSNLAIQIHEEIDKAKSNQKSEGKILDTTSESLNQQKTSSNIASVEHLSAIQKPRSSLYQDHKNLIDRFLQAIKSNDKLRTSAASEICEILSNEAKAEILLTFEGFKMLMKTTVQWSGNCWEDEWILSIVTLLLNNSGTQNVSLPRSTIDSTPKTENVANKVPVGPQPIESVPHGETNTAQSSVPSISENIDIEPDCGDINADQIINQDENTLSVDMCKQCYNGVKERLTPIIEEPENETSVKKRKKRSKKQKNSANKISHETVYKETSSTTETAVVDSPPTDLRSEGSSKDKQQITECETNSSKEIEEGGKRRHSQFAKCAKSQTPISPEDNSDLIQETGSEGKTNI